MLQRKILSTLNHAKYKKNLKVSITSVPLRITKVKEDRNCLIFLLIQVQVI